MTTQATLCAILNAFYPEQMKIAPPTISVTKNQTGQFVFTITFDNESNHENISYNGNPHLPEFMNYFQFSGFLEDGEFFWYSWHRVRQFEIRVDTLSGMGTVETFEKAFKQWVFAIQDQKKRKIDKLMSDIANLRKEASGVLELLRTRTDVHIPVSFDYEQPLR